MFGAGFDFVKGGKLPGLYGGQKRFGRKSNKTKQKHFQVALVAQNLRTVGPCGSCGDARAMERCMLTCPTSRQEEAEKQILLPAL